MEWYYAIVETYISISVYLVLHQIFVISSDFVEAFGVPPINIGIYVDKLSSIRALLMTIADIFEWSLTQEILGDPGNTKTLEHAGPRRILSVLSFFGLLCSRCCYLWVIYKSRNKAYVVFITLSVEGFWFGLFQMGFFAIGPEYNAFTSFALHVSGNFVLFFQELIEYFSASHPDWNSLFRVRVHAWIAVVTSIIAWPLWTYFCRDYIQGIGDEFHELVEELEYAAKVAAATSPGADEKKIAEALASAVKEGAEKFKELVTQLKPHLNSGLNATSLYKALNESTNNVKKAIVALVKSEFKITDTSHDKISAEVSGNTVTVTINKSPSGTASGYNSGSASVKDNVTITVKLDTSLKGIGGDEAKATGIAQRLAKAARKAKAIGDSGNYNPGLELLKAEFGLDNATVGGNEGEATVTVTAGAGSADNKHTATVNVKKDSEQAPDSANITIKVENAKSKSQAKRIAWKIGSALSQESVKKAGTGIDSITPSKIDGPHVTNSLSALCMFPLGAFTEDFMYPGLLPYAFLDPQNANLINYTMPLFYNFLYYSALNIFS